MVCKIMEYLKSDHGSTVRKLPIIYDLTRRIDVSGTPIYHSETLSSLFLSFIKAELRPEQSLFRTSIMARSRSSTSARSRSPVKRDHSPVTNSAENVSPYLKLLNVRIKLHTAI